MTSDSDLTTTAAFLFAMTTFAAFPLEKTGLFHGRNATARPRHSLHPRNGGMVPELLDAADAFSI